MAPIREPERPPPAIAPGAPGSGPLETAKVPFTRDQFTARKVVYPLANSWDLEFWALLPDEEVWIGSAQVDLAEDGLPNDPDGPNMYINKDHVKYKGQDRALETDGFSLTTAALEEIIRCYREDFGEDPPALGATLTMKNLLYFQQQYAIARDANPMAENAEWEQAAIRAIPFGANRIPFGYTVFEVVPGPSVEVDLGTTREGVTLGRRYVPSSVTARARLP